MATATTPLATPSEKTSPSLSQRIAGLNAQLSTTTSPTFGLVALWSMVGAAMYLVAGMSTADTVAASTGAIGRMVAPEMLETVFFWLRAAFFAAGLWWAFGIGVPFVGWASVALFTALAVLQADSFPATAQHYVVMNWILAAMALWYQLEPAPRATPGDTRLRTPAVPRWLPATCMLIIVVHAMLTGWHKILIGGTGWANGVTLQAWFYALADPEAGYTRFVLDHRVFALCLQVVLITAECFAFLALTSRVARCVIGLLLLATSLLVYYPLGIVPLGSLIPLAIFMLPIAELAPVTGPVLRKWFRTMFGFDD